jgi:hypothetical protein
VRPIYVLKCGDCPLYLPHCPAGHTNGKPVPAIPQECTHPDAKAVPADLTLGGPEVMPHKCPMLKQPLTYRAALQRKPS